MQDSKNAVYFATGRIGKAAANLSREAARKIG
jgi:hypothetical protein